MDLGGQRVATAFLFLNDVPEGDGGETSFPRSAMPSRNASQVGG